MEMNISKFSYCFESSLEVGRGGGLIIGANGGHIFGEGGGDYFRR